MADEKGGEIDFHAVGKAMADRRWKNSTPKQRKQVGKDLAAARKAKMTPEQRSEIARNAALARHGKARKVS